MNRLHDHGIGIQGSFIFGADQDDTTVFSDVLRFVENAHIEAAIFSVLTPFPGTDYLYGLPTKPKTPAPELGSFMTCITWSLHRLK